MTALILSAVFSSTSRSLPNSLTEFSPLTPEAASSTLSSMYCEKLKSTPGNWSARSLGQLRRVSFSLSMPAGQSSKGFERHEELGVEKAGGVGAVVGPAVLRDHRLDFGIALDDPAHPVDVAVAFLQRDRRRHGGADPNNGRVRRLSIAWIRATMPPSISLEESDGYVNRMRRLIKSYPEVVTVISQTRAAGRRHRCHRVLQRGVLRAAQDHPIPGRKVWTRKS